MEFQFGWTLYKYNGLIARNFEAGPAARVRADQLVVHPDHIVTRFGELGAVDLAGPGREVRLSCAAQPANLELG